jgi:exopolysaccharide production protein ExoZ
MGERFYGVQALRFAAATAVVVTHAVDLAGTRLGLETVLAGGTLENFGAVGVDVFFVISGFIIATTTRGQTGAGAAGAFLWRRFRRVAPIYWLLSLPILIGMARGGTLSPEVAAATFLFWPFSGLEMTFPALGPGWTLCFEMLFYAGFGLAIAGGRRVAWGLVGAYAAMLAAGLVVAAPVLRFWGAPIILEFLLGVGIATVWRFAPRRLGLWAVGLAVLGFGLGLVFGYGGIDDVRALRSGVCPAPCWCSAWCGWSGRTGHRDGCRGRRPSWGMRPIRSIWSMCWSSGPWGGCSRAGWSPCRGMRWWG